MIAKFLAFVGIFFLLPSTVSQAQTGSPRPNIIVILADDLRGDAFGVTGHPFSKTPNLDRIANEGVFFQNAFVTHSLCSPSRATLLTGLYSHQHRVRDNETALATQLPTVPKILQAQGYDTAYIGKWHMGHTEARPKPGFNRWVSFAGQGQYLDPPINVDGQQLQASGHMTDILTDYALEFIGRDRAAPFFMILSHKAVHNPFTAQPQFQGLYANANITFPATWGEDLSTKPAFLKNRLFTGALKPRIQQYYECLAGVEESMGKILAKLEDKNLLDNTFVVFTSDNGFFLGEHNQGDKRLAYEESMRIPIFIRYPQWFAAGSRIAAMALLVDLAPTLLEAANAPNTLNSPGLSLRKLARGETPRSSFLYQYFFDKDVPATPSMRAIRTPDYKYITYGDASITEELYDLKNDPIEKNNLINQPASSRVLQRLRFQLDSLRFAVKDTSAITSIEERRASVSRNFVLQQNYPNPFSSAARSRAAGNPTTTIQYKLPSAGHTRLEIFDVNGRLLATLVNERQDPGFKTVQWNAAGYGNGLYFYRLTTRDFMQTRKMTVLK